MRQFIASFALKPFAFFFHTASKSESFIYTFLLFFFARKTVASFTIIDCCP